jgi:(5-formylfuran-3-yl)methyl phosphate synthase
MVWMLASVADREEALVAVELGADFVDLKDPAQGALGAWPLEQVGEAVRAIEGRRPVSATIGDLPMEPERVYEAALAMAATAVDIVKVGFFKGGDAGGCITALAPLAERGVKLVAVMMADQDPDAGLLGSLAKAGFTGAMLDTADKRGGGLRSHLEDAALAVFLREAKGQGLLTGLAGSLTLEDIAPLSALGPDYLGFRGALCRGDRTSVLDREAFESVRTALDETAAA